MEKKIKCDRKTFLSRSALGQPSNAERKLFGISEDRRLHPDEYHEVYDDYGYVTIVHTPKEKTNESESEE